MATFAEVVARSNRQLDRIDAMNQGTQDMYDTWSSNYHRRSHVARKQRPQTSLVEEGERQGVRSYRDICAKTSTTHVSFSYQD